MPAKRTQNKDNEEASSLIDVLVTQGVLTRERGDQIKLAEVQSGKSQEEILKDQNIVTDEELTKAKEYLKGHLALALEDTHDVSSFFGSQILFMDNILTPEQIYKEVDKVTIKDVITEAKRLFVPSRLNLAIIGPFKEEKRFLDNINL